MSISSAVEFQPRDTLAYLFPFKFSWSSLAVFQRTVYFVVVARKPLFHEVCLAVNSRVGAECLSVDLTSVLIYSRITLSVFLRPVCTLSLPAAMNALNTSNRNQHINYTQ